METQRSSNTIFLNPKFKNIHINPNFLLKQNSKPNKIHINPLFMKSNTDILNNILARNDMDNEYETNQQFISQPTSSIVSMKIDSRTYDDVTLGENNISKMPIITKTNRKLIRKTSSVPFVKRVDKPVTPRSQLIKIGKNKLIRTSQNKPPLATKSISNVPNKLVKTGKTKINVSTYKIDRRSAPSINPPSLSKENKYSTHINFFEIDRRFDTVLTPKKVIITNKKLMKIGTTKTLATQEKYNSSQSNIQSKNKKLVMLNINGVLYKSTNTKLQKSVVSPPTTSRNIFSTNKFNLVSAASTDNKPGERILFIKGEKFILNPSATKLKRLNISKNIKLRRIDIGGITYVSQNDASVYIRTDSHRARSHLNNAKQKSINLLSNKMMKSNVPCPIYRRLGKCISFQRGKCQKVHKPEHIIICPKFLKGECEKDDCLLSHNVSLSKMPTCKFFLQGCCVRSKCPYLHKKLNDKEEICLEFLKGFCSLAEKCSKRHEFLCPDFESKGTCDKIRCPHPHREKKEMICKRSTINPIQLELNNQDEDIDVECKSKRQENIRYYTNGEAAEKSKIDDVQLDTENAKEETPDDIEVIIVRPFKRPKLGVLPSYIPL